MTPLLFFLHRVIPTAALLAALAAWPVSAAPPVTVPDTIAQRAQACTACHGEEGRATPTGYFPRIAGKPAAYLYQQLRHFREGRRQNVAMQRLMQPLSDAYLRELAGYFAGLDLPYPAPRPGAAAPQRGAQLVRNGDPARHLPACVACHGDSMTGQLPAVPGLLGLPSDYLIAQLGNWKLGQRHAAEPDCMAEVARALAPADVEALAQWLAAQPVPAGHAAPAPARDVPLPLRCGSVAP